MEQQLKERLVGAAVLVIASVLVIPWILDGPSKDIRTTQAIDLPPASSSDSSKTFRLSLTDDKAAQTEGPDRDDGTTIDAPVVTAEPAKSKTPGRESQSASAATAGWTVQVGSFSSRDNAQGLVGNLKSQGFEAYIDGHDSDGVQHFRVRVGNFKTRDAADALAIRVRGETGEPARPVQLPD